MKKLILLCLLIATVASAQTLVGIGQSGGAGGTTRNTTAAQDAATAAARDLDNAALCLAHGLAKTCNQAQLNASAPGCSGGGCGTIYTADAAGARQYAMDNLFTCYFSGVNAKVTATNVQDAASQTAINGGTVASNTDCANAVGGSLGNGCTRFQLACRALSGGTSSDCK